MVINDIHESLTIDENPLFPHFRDWSPGIRLHIWKHALPTRRTLKVKDGACDDSRPSFLGNVSAVPTICHVNRGREHLEKGDRTQYTIIGFLQESKCRYHPLHPPCASWTNGTLEQYLFPDQVLSSCGDVGVMPLVLHIAVRLNLWPAQALHLGPLPSRGLLSRLYSSSSRRLLSLLIEPRDQLLGLLNTTIVY